MRLIKSLEDSQTEQEKQKTIDDLYIYKDLFTHKDINTYINGVV